MYAFSADIHYEQYINLCSFCTNFGVFRFMVTGDSFRTVAYSYRIGVSSVHNIIKENMPVISRQLIPLVFRKPKREV